MKNISQLISVFILPCSLNCFAQEHTFSAEIGRLDFNWKEFAFNDDLFDKEYVEIVDENGNLNRATLGYSYTENYKSLSVRLSNTSGTVGYYGRISPDDPREFDYWDYGTSKYSNFEVEAEYGAVFEVDYVKPYAAILGGYTKRDRKFLGIEEPPVPPYHEVMDYVYWGLLLDVELVSWNGFSFNIGAQYTRSVDAEQDFVDRDVKLKLDPIVSTVYFSEIKYRFLETWSTSLIYENYSSKSDASAKDPATRLLQPESHEDHSYLGLRLEKSF